MYVLHHDTYASGRLRYMISYMISYLYDISYDFICSELSMISYSYDIICL